MGTLGGASRTEEPSQSRDGARPLGTRRQLPRRVCQVPHRPPPHPPTHPPRPALGVAWALMHSSRRRLSKRNDLASFPDHGRALGFAGTMRRATLPEAPTQIGDVLLYFFLLFVLGLSCEVDGGPRSGSRQYSWSSTRSEAIALGGCPYRLSLLRRWRVTVLRWGLVSFVTGTFVNALMFDAPATLDASAWSSETCC